MNKLINICSIILFCSFMFSCEDDPDVIDPDEVGIWKYYSTSNGLTNDDIRAIRQDHTGIIWVGTYGGGVCKYDNGNWSSIRKINGLLNDTVFSIEEDFFGDIWIGTSKGINIISDGRIDDIDTIFYPGEKILSLHSDSRGWMWIGTTYEILLYDYIEFYYVEFLDEGLYPIYAITEDNIGQVWFSTPGGAIGYSNKDEIFRIIDIEDGLYSNNIRCIFQDSWGNLWFGHMESERVTRWNGNNFEFINLFNGYSYPNVFSMVEDHNRNIWFTTANSGVICYDGVIPRTFGIRDGLKDYDIRCSMIDNKGNLWFGSDSLGIQIYMPE